MLIGNILKKLRQEKGLTIRDLASITGLSVGFLSNLERDINSPTVSSLAKICQALETNLVNLFQNTEQNSDKNNIIVRKNERSKLFASKRSKTTYELLSPKNKRLKAVCIVTEPGGDYGEVPLGHAGDEYGLVLQGTLEITVAEETYMLEDGDSVYIDAYVPHKYRNVGKGKCISLWVVQGAYEL